MSILVELLMIMSTRQMPMLLRVWFQLPVNGTSVNCPYKLTLVNISHFSLLMIVVLPTMVYKADAYAVASSVPARGSMHPKYP